MLQCHETPQSPPAYPPARVLFSVRRFAEKYREFTAATLRDLIFKSEERRTAKGKLPGNGLIEAGAILRVGRKVLIDEARFFAWLDAINSRPRQPAASTRA